MNKITVAALLITVLAVAAYFELNTKRTSSSISLQKTFSDWQEFIPQSKRFKVLLPSKPQYAKDYVRIPNSDKKGRYQIYASEKLDGTVFLISVVTYPSDIDTTNTTEVLSEIVKELVQSKLEEINQSRFQEHEAIDFKISSKDSKAEGKAIRVGENIFILTYIAHADDFNVDEYQYFVNSFVFLPKTNF